MNLLELTEYLVKNIVKDSENVSVQKNSEDDSIIEVFVSESDLGAVIGRSGKVANAIRTLVQAAAYTTDQGRIRINIDAKK
jgi:hypothetical protein